jgi:hypothetical protein
LQLPEAAVVLDPPRRLLHRRALEATTPLAPALGECDETGAFENPQVLVDPGQRHLERARELGHGGLGLRQPREDGSARRVGQGGEHDVQGAQFLINHLVKYHRPPSGRQAPAQLFWEVILTIGHSTRTLAEFEALGITRRSDERKAPTNSPAKSAA